MSRLDSLQGFTFRQDGVADRSGGFWEAGVNADVVVSPGFITMYQETLIPFMARRERAAAVESVFSQKEDKKYSEIRNERF